jgi:hypothetical protein
MGLFDEIAEKASQKIADTAQAPAKGQKPQVPGQPAPSTNVAGQALGLPESGVNPSDPSLSVGKKLETAPAPNTNVAGQALGQGETSVSPGDKSLAVGKQLELNPMPSTNPAQKAMGVGETDVAPGGPKSVGMINPPPIQVAKAAASELPAVGQNIADKAVKNPDPTSQASNPIAKASEEPNFWQKLMSVASTTGQSVFNLLGDFAMGYAGHPDLAPSMQRLKTEQALRLQQNPLQLQRDLLSIQQGFAQQQNQLDREQQLKLNTAAGNPLEQQRINNEYALRKKEIENQLLQILNTFKLEYMMKNLSIQNSIGSVGSAQAATDLLRKGG